MKNKFYITLFCTLMLCLTSIGLFTNNINADEYNGCIIAEDGKIICVEDIPEGCEIDFENNEIICPCPIEPLGNNCNGCPRD